MILCFTCRDCGCEWCESDLGQDSNLDQYEIGQCPCCESFNHTLRETLNEFSLEMDEYENQEIDPEDL